MYLKRHLQSFFSRRPRRLTSQAAYDLWAAHYPAAAHNRLMQVEQAALLALLPALAGCTVLDLACGTGRYARLAQAGGAARVLGTDHSLAMLRGMATPAALAEMAALPLAAASVDVVLCGLAVGHVPRLRPIFGEISRVLRPGGCALLSDLHPFQALQGAQRTFTTADGRTFAVEHYLHLMQDYHQAAQSTGLSIDSVAEPALNERGPAPVVLVVRLGKRALTTAG